MHEYYSVIDHWFDSGFGVESSVPEGTDYAVSPNEDPHLRSVVDLSDYEVWAPDGEMGHVQGFLMDKASWHFGFLDVNAGSWLLNRSVLIPTAWVESISWARRRVTLHQTRQGA